MVDDLDDMVAEFRGEPKVAGMAVTPGQRHVVYDAQGGIRVTSTDTLILLVTSLGSTATYSATTGKQVAPLPGTIYEALPIGSQVVTSDQDKRLRVWDAWTAEKAAESSPLSDRTWHLQRYGHEVVGATRDSNIIRCDWRAGPNPRQHPFYYSQDFSQVAVRENTHTVTIAVDKEAKAYSLDDDSTQYLLRWKLG
jgi:hypothetical protein